MKIKGKILAMMLVFTMTFSYFATVTEAVAVTDFVSLFGNNDQDSENVEFEAYFSEDGIVSDTIASDVNSESLSINLQLDVLDKGYLKDGKIEIKAEEDKTLNFSIKEENNVLEENNTIQSLENNVLTLRKIDNSSDKVEINVPIEYVNEEYINEEKLNGKTKVILTGIYVDDEGKENEIIKEVELVLSWKDNRNVTVDQEVTKYIKFSEDGVILQTSVKVDSSNLEKNTLPIKSTSIDIDVPTIENIKPEQINVIANSTKGTNGKDVADVDFNENNWEYNKEENKLNINVENTKQLVDVVSNTEFLKENEEVKQEERYYSNGGVDEYLITYTYKGISNFDSLSTKMISNANVEIFSGDNSEENVTVVSAEKESEYKLEGQTGNLVSYDIENKTEEVSKVYGYLNKEVEFESKTAINVSYKDLVEQIIVEDLNNSYINKDQTSIETEDVYYKQILISQTNFNEILGENGNIEISDLAGNVITVLDKNYAVDENGNYVVNFANKISRVSIKTSNPIAEGNLVITNKKAISTVSIDKSVYANVESIVTNTIQKVKFSYVSDLVDLESKQITTKLVDTKTDINLKLDRDNLSTVTTNLNVEIRLELNNDKEESDIFGNSIFEVEMPEYVTGLNVTNATMIYEEGLSISNVETYTNEQGKIVIKITVDGKQTDLNSGVLTNGTNIVINADITLDKYAPSMENVVKAYASNSEATNYANMVEFDGNACDVEEFNVNYSAPNGVVAINTISGYNDIGTALTSIKEGKKTDYIDIYSSAKVSTMEVVVLNNNDNTISDLSILGRIPFKGVKDISTGKDLGTTLDTKMLSGIVSDVENSTEFMIYYSENGEATKDLNNKENAWNANPESFENIKSYLIVPIDENYKMQSKEKFKFTYTYEIPENLNHNENIYGTFLTYYTNNSEVATTDEESKPDLVGLTTGVGPEVELKMTSDVEKVKVNDEIKLNVEIKNSGKDPVKDVDVNVPVLENTTFVEAKADRENVTTELIEGNVVLKTDSLSVDTTINETITLKVEDILENKTEIATATVSAKDLGAEVNSNNIEIKFESAEINIEQYVDNEEISTYHFEKGEELEVALFVENLTESKKENISVVTTLPKELEFTDAYMLGNDGISKVENASYDSNTNKVVWTMDKLEADDANNFKLHVTAGDLAAGTTQDTVKISSQVTADNTDTYNAEDINVNLGKTSLAITQTTTNQTYVNEEDTIAYKFEIVNEGSSIANDVKFVDKVPEGIIVKRIEYRNPEGENISNVMSENSEATATLSINANSTLDVYVYAIASKLDGVQEKTITNVATISKDGMDEITSNSVTNIIKATETIDEGNSSDNSTNNTANSFENTDITKTYKISGTAWLDKNSNGMRDDDETRMSNIQTMLVDSNSGVIKATTNTNENGEYVFAGLQNGQYLVIFKYNTTLYTTTTYKQEGIESNINSDVVTTKIEQDGRKENAGITDVINLNGANVSSIDLGLVESAQFNLNLDKSITKITVQNSQETVTEEFDNTKLGKYDIAAKRLSGTTVYVEYEFKVTNIGDLSGFATEIVDYIPNGMTFNSNLNPDWYTGTDGNLYTKALADIELAKGESRTIKLVLTKQMTAENTGLASNTAEISDDYNIYGVSDINSKPGNKAQGEDDISTADVILTVKTGETLIYMSGIIIGIMLGATAGFVIYKKLPKTKKEGGV